MLDWFNIMCTCVCKGKMIMFFIIIIVIIKEGSCIVCNKTISVIREVPETYQFSYYEAYEGKDCLLCPCTKSRLAVSTGIRIVQKVLNETVTICCEGYVEDNEYYGDGLKCIPICEPPCQNGFCRKPNECACDPGFAVNPHDHVLNRCLPLCLEDCSIPNCLPTCSRKDYTDIDSCLGNCLNGTCVGGSCHCNPGYTSQSGICKPTCSSCEHGTCVAPDVCKCNFGYIEECNACKPFCYGCEHGKCKSPGQCECNPGYKAVNGRCEPFCEDCDGKCVAPNTCACAPGWYSKGGRCWPHCSIPCGNGTCVAPDVCHCYLGYQIQTQENYDGPVCQPECIDCSYECVAPGICKSIGQYEPVHPTEDRGVCDCVQCENINSNCVNLTCKTTSTEMGEIDESVGTVTERFEEIIVHTNQEDATMPANQPVLEEQKPCYHLETAETQNNWIPFTLYVSVIVVEFLIILLLLAFLQTRYLSNRRNERKFVPQDIPNSEVAVQYTKKVEDA